MFRDSIIVLSEEDLEAAIAYWLTNEILAYGVRDKQKISFHFENGEYKVQLSPLPSEPKPE